MTVRIQNNHVTADLNFDAVSKMLPQIVLDSLEDVADAIVTMAKSLAPVDTGTLRDSIRWEVTEIDGKAGIVIVADPIQDRAPDGYAVFIEFGTSINPPQPFLTPAIEHYRDQIAAIVSRKFDQEMRSVK